MQGQQQSKNLSNASLSPAKLTTSGEDAGENIMAATPACGPAKRIPEQVPDPMMLLNFAPLNARYEIFGGILAGL
jgi:hypothetical protein